ncbi:MAG TPA: outer membrane protein assembly factor BamE [Planctomycetota bacterium]|nr:outer membrane protein assembly factor BamE [Planctomycetota bacterium]
MTASNQITNASLLLTLALAATLAGCVNVDPDTGETIPRGNQRYEFSKVTESAERLHPGMNKLEVLFLLGSPAEKDDAGDTWIYLPERPAVLLPARALQLTFKEGVLVEHGYRAIVLGQKL